MAQLIVAVTGVSGVGKSTALNNLADEIEFQHLIASDLIRSEIRRTHESIALTDELRDKDIDENQLKLIFGYRQALDPSKQIVVLDGHTVIDTSTGLQPVGFDVFGAIGIDHLVMLVDDPSSILRRRSLDDTRNRPVRDIGEIREYQFIAQNHAFLIALELQIPYTVLPLARAAELRHAFYLQRTENH